jgi:hypothetical protein
VTEPLPRAGFDALLERAGLGALPEEEREEVRLATRHVAAFAAKVRAGAASLGARTRDRLPCGGGQTLTIPTIAKAAALLATRRVSPVELAKAALRRAERLHPVLHAFIRLTPERALADARASEARHTSGTARGPLDGVPIRPTCRRALP